MNKAMSWTELERYDAVGLAELIEKGDVTANEVAKQSHEAIRALDDHVSSVVEVFDDVVENPSKDGTNLEGSFKGVPYLMKDLGPTLAGRLQEMGSKLMQGNRAEADSFLTSKIRSAGLNIIGRTTTPEYGLCSSAENPELYVTRNPWNQDYTSCGSSAGSSVAVAAGMVPLAHASDGGGSIRIPAGVNGIIGMKSSRGVLSVSPNGSDLMGVVSTQGCVSRTIRDSAMFYDECRGGAPGEFMPYWSPEQSYSSLIAHDPKPLRIAVSHEWGDYKADPHIVSELTRTAEFLESLGHHVEWQTPKVDFYKAYQAQTDCYIMNFSQVIAGLMEQKGLKEPPSDLIEPMCIRVWEEGIDATYSKRAAMQAQFNDVSRQVGMFLEEWDIILTPTMAKPTPAISTKEYMTTSEEPNVYDWFQNLWSIFSFTPIANVTGIPGISLPMATLENGLPLGMHFLTRQANDGLLLQLGAQIERALDGAWNGGNKPEVHVSKL
ncbi:amidase [Geomicrobium sediminis]|uniref:Asp-tRNA(Asn)/Glu-tRNA(Gln) amidotransferase A subunit family amidase n=1 Tax=Geomicrobium sediminis TaxID=1347788 RepID=A0ABS2PC48_9BACL|nr:amidase [Geomicrobium sediminis]MBM7632862.1 Asp-tRNA(Asn)/Glu-tRNA(Gln) amidotransferase A subunit family amidase [Geomicrobium sediminis]